MKKLVLALTVVSLLQACSTPAKTQAIRSAVDQKQFKGLDNDSTFSITVPRTHSGVYQSVDQLNFIIDLGSDEEKNASAILGKSRNTGEWEVLKILVQQDGQWSTLSKHN